MKRSNRFYRRGRFNKRIAKKIIKLASTDSRAKYWLNYELGKAIRKIQEHEYVRKELKRISHEAHFAAEEISKVGVSAKEAASAISIFAKAFGEFHQLDINRCPYTLFKEE